MNAHLAGAGHEVVEYKPVELVLVPHGQYHVGQELWLHHDGHEKHVHVVHVEHHDEHHDRLHVTAEAPAMVGDLVH